MGSTLRLFNTMTGKKEVFRPRRPPRVSMFVCGPTVQARIHLGHARTYIFYDALVRYLRYRGYDVFYLMNITDIDESITRVAERKRENPLEYATRMASSFLGDLNSLGVTTVSRIEPVSHHMNDVIRQVSLLLRGGFAYRADAWVYFDTSKFRWWGKLSHQSKKDLALRPLELSPKKRNLTDFALWRPEVLIPGKWASPWGVGSPGWHVQDTAVTLPILGPQYDIHGGAYELVYPHHEAEIAQAESITKLRPLVRYWVHTNLLNMEGQKMSKSLGNVVTVEDALRNYPPEVLRFYFLSIHYREEADLSGMDAAKRAMERMCRAARVLAKPRYGGGDDLVPFEEALDDDFDSPKAIRWAEGRLKAAAMERDPMVGGRLAWSAVNAMRILGVDLVGSA